MKSIRPLTRLILTAGTLSFVALGLASCAPENVEACKRYVEAQNQAYRDCGMPDREKDANETCPASLNEGLDCTDYYDNLARSFDCSAGEVTWDSNGSCT